MPKVPCAHAQRERVGHHRGEWNRDLLALRPRPHGDKTEATAKLKTHGQRVRETVARLCPADGTRQEIK